MRELKLIRIYAERKYLLGLRTVLLLVALPFMLDAYDIVVSGIADNGRTIRVQGEDWGYYLFLLKKIVFALFFIWIAIWGLKEKEPAASDDQADGGNQNQ